MEDFVLYNELSKTCGQVIYKARRKGTINYLAVSCANRHMRALISNHVRIISDLKHSNILQFYDWYETSNHLWLVMELCTGGTLDQVLKQDGQLGERLVRKFGADIFKGLDYLHSRGIVFNELNPSRFVVDAKGNVKLFDMSSAHRLDEQLDDVLNRLTDEDELVGQEDRFERPSFSNFMALETLEFGKVATYSDYWGLGCLLYLMAYGTPPFSAESRMKLIHCIKSCTVPMPAAGGKEYGRSLLSLLSDLLVISPVKRISRDQLIKHEFWQNRLNDLNTSVSSSTTEQVVSLESSYTPENLNGDIRTQVVTNGDDTRVQKTTSMQTNRKSGGQTEQDQSHSNYNSNKLNLHTEGANFTLHSNAIPPCPSNPDVVLVTEATEGLNGECWMPDSRMVQSEYPGTVCTSDTKKKENENQVRARYNSINLEPDAYNSSLRNIAHDANFRPCPVPIRTRFNLAATYLWGDDASYLPREPKLLLSLWQYLKGQSLDAEGSKLPQSVLDPIDCLWNGWHPGALNEYSRWARAPAPSRVEGLVRVVDENQLRLITVAEFDKHILEIAKLLSFASTTIPTGLSRQSSTRSSGKFGRPNLLAYTKWLTAYWITIHDNTPETTDSDDSLVDNFISLENIWELLDAIIQQLGLCSTSASVSYRVELCRLCSILLYHITCTTCRQIRSTKHDHTYYDFISDPVARILPICLTVLVDILKDSSSVYELTLRQVTLLALGEWINCTLCMLSLTTRYRYTSNSNQPFFLDFHTSVWQTIILHLTKSLLPTTPSALARPMETNVNKTSRSSANSNGPKATEQHVRLAAARVLNSMVTSILGYNLHQVLETGSAESLIVACVTCVTTRELVVRLWVDGLFSRQSSRSNQVVQRNQINQEIALICANALCGIMRIQPNLFTSLVERISCTTFSGLLEPPVIGQLYQQTDLVARLLSMATMGLILPCSGNKLEGTNRYSIVENVPNYTRQMSAPSGGAGMPASCRRILSDRQFIQAVLRHLKSPLEMIRSKAYLLLSAILTSAPKSSFALVFDAHLPGLLERDLKSTIALQNRYVDLRSANRRASSSTLTDCSSTTYLAACSLHFTDVLLTHLIPTVCEQILIAVGCINPTNAQHDPPIQPNVRRRPSYATILSETQRVSSAGNISLSNQKSAFPDMISAKSWLPAYTALAYLLSNCSTIRVRLLLPESTRRHSDACSFCLLAFIGRLFEFWTSTDTGSPATAVTSTLHQRGSTEDHLLCVTLTIVEDLCQYADLIEARQRDWVCMVLPGIARLTAAPRARSEIRAICVKIVARLAEVILGETNYQSSTGSLSDLLEDGSTISSSERPYSTKAGKHVVPMSDRPLSADVELLLKELNQSASSDLTDHQNDEMSQSLYNPSTRTTVRKHSNLCNQKPDRTKLPSTLGSAVQSPSSAVLSSLFDLVNKLMIPYVDAIISCSEITAPTAFMCLLNNLLNSIPCPNLPQHCSPISKCVLTANGNYSTRSDFTSSPSRTPHYLSLLNSIHSTGLDIHLVRLLCSQISHPLDFNGVAPPLQLKGSVTSALCFSILQTIPLLMYWPKYSKPSHLIVQLRLVELVNIVCLELGKICFPIHACDISQRRKFKSSYRPHTFNLLNPNLKSKSKSGMTRVTQNLFSRLSAFPSQCYVDSACIQLHTHLITGLKALNALLEYVSNVVRITLASRNRQTRETETAAMAAEQILFAARPSPNIAGLLATCIGLWRPRSYEHNISTSSAVTDNQDIILDDDERRQLCEAAVTCLTNYASLYGGEYCNSALTPPSAASLSLCLLRLAEEHQENFRRLRHSQSCPSSDDVTPNLYVVSYPARSQMRLLLRIIRRLVSSDLTCRRLLAREALEDGVTNLYTTLVFLLHHTSPSDPSTAKILYEIIRFSNPTEQFGSKLKSDVHVIGVSKDNNSTPTLA